MASESSPWGVSVSWRGMSWWAVLARSGWASCGSMALGAGNWFGSRTYMHSVLLLLSPCQTCTNKPNFANCLMIMLRPWIRSRRELKMKAPSSMYKILRMLKVVPELNLLGVCPMSMPFVMLSSSTLWQTTFSMLVFSISSFSDLATADITNRNSTGDRLSPCLTPLDCGIVIFLPSRLITTVKPEYNLLMMLQNSGGAPYLARSSMRRQWLAVS